MRRKVSIPLISGLVIHIGGKIEVGEKTGCLNPFDFRAGYSRDENGKHHHQQNVSIPLISGLVIHKSHKDIEMLISESQSL